jgi:uncharacterized protein (TIGR03437 family)
MESRQHSLTSLSTGRVKPRLISNYFGSNSLPAHGTLQTSTFCLFGFTPGTTATFGFAGQDASRFQWTQQASLQLGPLEQLTAVNQHGLANGASFQEAFAPGMILSVFGRSLAGSAPQEAASLPLPVTLAGSSVKINNVSAPFYYASAGQLNAQIPYETQPGTAILSVTVAFSDGATQTDNYSFTVSPSAPGIFADRNQNTVPFASGNRGGTYTFFLTGDGAVSPPAGDGRNARSLHSIHPASAAETSSDFDHRERVGQHRLHWDSIRSGRSDSGEFHGAGGCALGIAAGGDYGGKRREPPVYFTVNP